ncbi:DUF2948 family protein [Oryzifoliimicrobium ureilyticus]|uniref:DUF2948 family protein n=1 Tax=Oryzifoliimicrobium ureilyticus TaxID=3113724 RepID=UPI0030762536
MTDLKLVALDTEDLSIISAHMQDSVFKLQDVSWSQRDMQFAVAANRFVWEENLRKRKSFERRRAALIFKRVLAVRSIGFDRNNKTAVLSLLSVTFQQKDQGPEGEVILTLAGGGEIVLEVECIEVQLADVGGAWETASRPRHPGV